MIYLDQGVRLTLSSRISIFALSYWYLFRLRMNMESIIYCRPRQATLKFVYRYFIANQGVFCMALRNYENPAVLSRYGMHEQETHKTKMSHRKKYHIDINQEQ